MPAPQVPSASHPSSGRRRLRSLLLSLVLMLVVLGCLVGFAILVPPDRYTPLTGQPDSQVTLLAVGDQGTGDLQQWRVAQGMERVAEGEGGVNMVLLLGDNFYGASLKGTGDLAWQLKFERVYHGRWLSRVPFYAVLGNHDSPGSDAAELEYAHQGLGSGRWQMPDRSYTRDFGKVENRPLLRVVFLDTNQDSAGLARQMAFLEAAFSRPGPAPIWKMVVAHHVLRSSGGKHGENQELLRQLLPAMQRSAVDIYLSGHEHNQQLIVRPGEPAWLISGGGGQSLDAPPPIGPKADTPFAAERHGFARLAFTAAQLQLTYYDANGGQAQPFLWTRACQGMALECLRHSDRMPSAMSRASAQ
ncbi:metallophosphoesterase [Enterobacterales bacterium AE_CKDN230030158-1A_HGKHYDSX7]